MNAWPGSSRRGRPTTRAPCPFSPSWLAPGTKRSWPTSIAWPSYLTPQIVGRQGPDGAFGGPLSTALALAALLDLGYRGPALAPARTALLNGVDPLGGWGYEDFVIHGFGSPALTTAVALAALVRYRSWLRPHEAAQQHPEW